MAEREKPYEGEEAEAPATDQDLEDELPGVPGATPADDPSDGS